MKSDSEILFSRIRNIALKKPYRSEKFKKFVKSRSGSDLDFHHAFGSVHGLKSTDLLGVAVGREEHSRGEMSKDWLIEQMPKAIENLIEYVKHLEENDTARKKN